MSVDTGAREPMRLAEFLRPGVAWVNKHTGDETAITSFASRVERIPDPAGGFKDDPQLVVHHTVNVPPGFTEGYGDDLRSFLEHWQPKDAALAAGVGEARPAEPPELLRSHRNDDGTVELWFADGTHLTSAPAEEQPDARATCPSCGGDAGDNWFDRSLCACEVMHTRCRTCGAALDGCEYEASGASAPLAAQAKDCEEQQRTIEWWAENYERQVGRVREALSALGVEDPVNYTGEIRNFRADGLREQLDAARQALQKIAVNSECIIGLSVASKHGKFCAYHTASEALLVARAALGDVAAPPNQTTDEVGALRQRAPETREETEA